MKTHEQIEAEIAALNEMKPNVQHHSAFGDDNHEAIEAQLSVLRERMDIDEIYDAWGDEDSDEFAQYVLDEALAARDWMVGDGLAPSEGWVALTAGHNARLTEPSKA